MRRIFVVLILLSSSILVLMSERRIVTHAQSGGTPSPSASPSLSPPVISASNANKLALLYDFADAKQDEWIEDVAFSPDSSLLATIDSFGIVVLYDARTATKQKLLDPNNNPGSETATEVAFSPNGDLLASTSDSDIFIWDVQDVLNHDSPSPKFWLKGHDLTVGSFAFSPDSKLLVSGDVNPNAGYFKDETAKLRWWDVSTGQQLQVFDTHDSSIGNIFFSPDGKSLAFPLDDDLLHVWSVVSREQVAVYKMSANVATTFAYKQDGSLLAAEATYMDNPANTISIIEVKSGKTVTTFHTEDHLIGTVMAFNSDATLLASGDPTEGGTGIDIWDTATGKAVGHINGPGAVTSIVFSPNGTLLADGQDGAGAAQAFAHLWGVKANG